MNVVADSSPRQWDPPVEVYRAASPDLAWDRLEMLHDALQGTEVGPARVGRFAAGTPVTVEPTFSGTVITDGTLTMRREQREVRGASFVIQIGEDTRWVEKVMVTHESGAKFRQIEMWSDSFSLPSPHLGW